MVWGEGSVRGGGLDMTGSNFVHRQGSYISARERVVHGSGQSASYSTRCVTTAAAGCVCRAKE